ncbi:MAG: hypothetical protein R2771_07260 [Saprospiraceae bacterium]
MKLMIIVFGKGNFTLTIFLAILFSDFCSAQNSPFHLNVGYEQLYVSPKTTDGIAKKKWIWLDETNNDEYFTLRTTLSQALDLGISYDLLKWLSFSLNYKTYYRKYYEWDGTYISEDKTQWGEYGHFGIIPFVGSLGIRATDGGRWLSVSSWQIGIDGHHFLNKNRNCLIHYYFSFNSDKYERELQYFDLPKYFESNGWYTDVYSGQKVYYVTKGTLTLRGKNPWQFPQQPSMNLALGLSRILKNGMGIKAEPGFIEI